MGEALDIAHNSHMDLMHNMRVGEEYNSHTLLSSFGYFDSLEAVHIMDKPDPGSFADYKKLLADAAV